LSFPIKLITVSWRHTDGIYVVQVYTLAGYFCLIV
jgi:hypothetical protein